MSIQSRVPGGKFLELFVIREKNLCKASNTYLGEFWYALERQFQMPVKTCPIPAVNILFVLVTFEFEVLSFDLKMSSIL